MESAQAFSGFNLHEILLRINWITELGISSVVEPLPRMCETLGLFPSTTNKNNQSSIRTGGGSSDHRISETPKIFSFFSVSSSFLVFLLLCGPSWALLALELDFSLDLSLLLVSPTSPLLSLGEAEHTWRMWLVPPLHAALPCGPPTQVCAPVGVALHLLC